MSRGRPIRVSHSTVPASSGQSREKAVQKLEVVQELTRGEEEPRHPALCVLAESRSAFPVAKEANHSIAECLEVMRVVNQESSLAVLDLVLDAPYPAGDNGLALPHCLTHREAEALRHALLHHHLRPPLQSIDDDGVLVHVLHGQAGDVHELAQVVRQAAPGILHFSEDLRPLGIVGDRARSGAARTRCASTREAVWRMNASSTPAGSFSRSQRETCTTRRSVGPGGGCSVRARCCTRASEPSGRWNTGRPAGPPSRPLARSTLATVSGSSSWFLHENASMPGGMTTVFASSKPKFLR